MPYYPPFELAALARTALALATAFVLGGLIGFERQWRQRTAGLRTNVLVAVGAVMAFGLGLALLAAAASAIKQPALALVVALLTLAGIAAFLFVVVRLGFLIAPVTVAEEQISLTRGWVLTAGNFWRLVAVILAIGMPLFLVYAAGMAVIGGPELFAPLPAAPEAMDQALNARLASFGQHMPSYIGLTLLVAPFSLGLNLGAAAFAYRALVPTGIASKV